MRFPIPGANRSAFIDNVDIEERNKAAVIAELTYSCVCSLAPGDAATLISKPKSTPAGRTFRIKDRLNGRIAIVFSRYILIHNRHYDVLLTSAWESDRLATQLKDALYGKSAYA